MKTIQKMPHNRKVDAGDKPPIAHLRIVLAAVPNPVSGKVPPRRLPNHTLRTREHLTPAEVEALMAAAGRLGRHGHRDATLILLAYRHGLRVGELIALRWDQLDLRQGSCTSPGSSTAYRPHTRSGARSCAPSGAFSAITRRRPTYSRPNAGDR
jgi:integrase